MVCLYPVYVSVKGVKRLVPCGKCIVCETKKIKEWYVRILSEVGYCDYSKFVCFTYDDLYIPLNLSLNHEHYKLFVKRLRKDLDKINVKLKYYMCGEYGEQKGRPHYHAILLFYGEIEKDVDLSNIVRNNWTLGLVHIGNVTPRSVNYCIGYVKKLISNHDDERVKPYQKMSKGLGENYLFKNEKYLAKKGYVEINGYKYALPRYFRKKSELIKEKIDDSLLSEDYASVYNELEKNYSKNKFDIKKDEIELIKNPVNSQYELNKLQEKKIKRGGF